MFVWPDRVVFRQPTLQSVVCTPERGFSRGFGFDFAPEIADNEGSDLRPLSTFSATE
ncbi:MAG: hypothetical protein R3C49_06070 [Planctomycetaceae bacterium]